MSHRIAAICLFAQLEHEYLNRKHSLERHVWPDILLRSFQPNRNVLTEGDDYLPRQNRPQKTVTLFTLTHPIAGPEGTIAMKFCTCLGGEIVERTQSLDHQYYAQCTIAKCSRSAPANNRQLGVCVSSGMTSSFAKSLGTS